jgi:hypothetical protein
VDGLRKPVPLGIGFYAIAEALCIGISANQSSRYQALASIPAANRAVSCARAMSAFLFVGGLNAYGTSLPYTSNRSRIGRIFQRNAKARPLQ